MKNKLILKILVIILAILSIFTLSNNCVQASSLSETIEGADDFIHAGVQDTAPTFSEGEMQQMSDMLYNPLLVIATIIAVIVGLVIAIPFMTGSVGERAKIKETLIPYIAGCIVIFGAFGIWKLVVNILSQTQ